MSTQTRDSNHNHLQRESMTGLYKSMMINCLFFYFLKSCSLFLFSFYLKSPCFLTTPSQIPHHPTTSTSPQTSPLSSRLLVSPTPSHVPTLQSIHVPTLQSRQVPIHSMQNPSPLHQTSLQPFKSDKLIPLKWTRLNADKSPVF